MRQNGNRPDPPDISLFFQNRPHFPKDELQRYAGLHVAWSPDGLRILASGETMEAVEQQLIAAGIDPSQVIGDFVSPPEFALFYSRLNVYLPIPTTGIP
jgi:hypothetical protein